jgi:hypothetical protein
MLLEHQEKFQKYILRESIISYLELPQQQRNKYLGGV